MKKYKYISLLGFTFFFSIVLTAFINKDEIVKLPKSIKNQFSFIPNGKVFNGKDTVTTNAFYISKYEVSNRQYNEFLNYIKKKDVEAYMKAKVDTANWVKEFSQSFMEPMSNMYHFHEAYREFPVVNISKEGAQLYCNWLTQKLNAERQTGTFSFEVRLPSRIEWLRASNGNHREAAYSWGSDNLRNKDGKLLCNFLNFGAENITFDRETDSYKVVNKQHRKLENGFFITASVASYFPNDFDLYNMNGNVAEMVMEGVACGGSWCSTGYDVRNQSVVPFEKSSCKVGFRPILIITGRKN